MRCQRARRRGLVGRKARSKSFVRSTVPTIESRATRSRPRSVSDTRPSASTTSSNGRMYPTSSGSKRSRRPRSASIRALRARAKSFCASSAGKPVPTVRPGGRLGAGADGPAVERIVDRRDEGEDAIQPGDLERLHDGLIVADDDQRSLALLEPPVRANQHPEARRVDERGGREVDDQARDAVLDRLRHALLELGRGEEVDLARDGHEVDAVADPPVLHLEVDRHQLAYASRTSRYSA